MSETEKPLPLPTRQSNATGRSLLLAIGAAMALGSCGVSGSQPVGFASRIGVAEQMLTTGQYERGYRLLDDVSQENASSGPAHLAIGNAYLRTDAFLKSEQAFRAAMANGEQVSGKLGLGRVALARNRSDQAFQHFSDVLADDPTNLVALNGRGVSYDLAGQHALARSDYQAVLDIDPTYVPSINNMGLSLAIAGSGERAVNLLSDLANSQLNDATIRQNLAIAYYVTGRKDEALSLSAADLDNEKAKNMMDAVVWYRRNNS